jgi:tRNA 2-selenouridine synthase SelU
MSSENINIELDSNNTDNNNNNNNNNNTNNNKNTDSKNNTDNNLENRLKIIEQKLDRLLELMENDCKKMSDHIDFVENIYDKVKTPFNYVMNSVSTILYNDTMAISDIDK